MAAYGSAMQRGYPRGAVSLGLLLAQRGDLSGALEAFSYADQLGDGAGAFNLGVVLETQGDLDGAVSAFTRAQSSSDADVAEKARAALIALSRQSAD